MMLHAWSNYEKYAWGSDHLRPCSKTSVNAHKGPLAFTLIDSLDTLFIMGLEPQFKKARDYVATMDVVAFLDQDVDISFFETTIRVLGGLVAAGDVSGDQIFIQKASKIAERLLIAFDTPTGLPNNCINLKTGQHTLPGWSGGFANMAEIATNVLEFSRLSQQTGDPRFHAAAKKTLKYLDEIIGPKLPVPHLFPIYVHVTDGRLRFSEESTNKMEYTVGACTDSFYEYLLKMWIQSNKSEHRYGEWFDESITAIKQHILKYTTEGLAYLPSGYLSELNTEMQHLTCFAAGMIALSVISGKSKNPTEDTEIAAKLTETGYFMYKRNPLFLSPEVADLASPTLSAFKNQTAYLQRPEVVESIFYMWRLTHDPKYREWNWEIAQAIERETRVEGGYSGLVDASVAGSFNDTQDSYFLAETLKYLFLTFSDDQLIPLDKFVFTTEAHPIKIEGK